MLINWVVVQQAQISGSDNDIECYLQWHRIFLQDAGDILVAPYEAFNSNC
jgi:hypothetical protein